MGKLPRKVQNLDQQKPGRWTRTKQIGIEGYELGSIKLVIHSLLLFGILQGEFKVQSEQIEKPPGRSVDLAEAFEYFSGDYSQLGAVTWKHWFNHRLDVHLRNCKWLISRMSSTCRIYPTYVRIITHLLHGMQPEAQRGGVACASGEDGEHGLRRLVDSSTMDVKYPVVWRERTELWISVWISMIFHDIPGVTVICLIRSFQG